MATDDGVTNVYATAMVNGTELVTSDRDFPSLPGVEYREK